MPFQQKIISLSVIFCLTVLAIVFLIINPLLKDVKESSEEFVFQKNLQTENQLKIENLKNAQIAYQAEQQKIQKINLLLIDKETPLDFIEFLEKMADDFELLIEISPGSFKKSKIESSASVNFHITLTGSFDNFSKFLEKLETSAFPTAANYKGFLIDVLSLDIKKLSEQDAKDITAALSIKVYAK
jgi:hypothetical protein